MKTLIIIIIMAGFFVSGCGGYENPEITRIQTEWDTTVQGINELSPVVDDWTERHTQFLFGLTADKLEVYAEFSKPGTEIEMILRAKRVRDILSEDERQALKVLVDEQIIWGPKLQYLIDQQQRLRKQFESLRQNVYYESQRRRARSQIMLQQYYQHYQQQQLQQSLIGIENAIRNQ